MTKKILTIAIVAISCVITFVSCTKELDTLSERVDSLDERVTALESDTKIIKQNLSTVTSDLATSRKTISTLQSEVDESLNKLNGEINDTETRLLRLSNDLQASKNLIDTAIAAINNLKTDESKLSQSIADAYAAIKVVQSLEKTNSNGISDLSSRLSKVETSLAEICTNCVFSRDIVNTTSWGIQYQEKNKYGYILHLRRYEKTYSYMEECYYVPGSDTYKSYRENDNMRTYTEYNPNSFVLRKYVQYYVGISNSLWDKDILYGPEGSGIHLSRGYYSSCSESISKDGYVSQNSWLVGGPNSYFWFLEDPNPTNSYYLYIDKTGKNGKDNMRSYVLLKEDSEAYFQVRKFIENIYDDHIDGASNYTWSEFSSSWNSFVDSTNYLDTSFKF